VSFALTAFNFISLKEKEVEENKKIQKNERETRAEDLEN